MDVFILMFCLAQKIPGNGVCRGIFLAYETIRTIHSQKTHGPFHQYFSGGLKIPGTEYRGLF
jgi:hypothetical protein